MLRQGNVFTDVCLPTGGTHHTLCGYSSPPDTTGYGRQAGGTHPTGMLSCTKLVSNQGGQLKWDIGVFRNYKVDIVVNSGIKDVFQQ